MMMPQEITDIGQVEIGDTIGKGMVDWTVTDVQYESGGFGGDRPHVELEVVDGDDDADAWPDEGATETVRESKLQAGWEIRD